MTEDDLNRQRTRRGPQTEPDRKPPSAPSAVQSLGAMWAYTLLRFGLFFVIWGVLWVARVPGFLAAVIALLLSVPLSFVLLNRQRQKVAANLEQRIEARRARSHDLDGKLSGTPDAEDRGDAAGPRDPDPTAD